MFEDRFLEQEFEVVQIPFSVLDHLQDVIDADTKIIWKPLMNPEEGNLKPDAVLEEAI